MFKKWVKWCVWVFRQNKTNEKKKKTVFLQLLPNMNLDGNKVLQSCVETSDTIEGTKVNEGEGEAGGTRANLQLN